MNYCVDTNQTHYLLLIIMLAATICYEMKDFVRALHYYIQAVNIYTNLVCCRNFCKAISSKDIKLHQNRSYLYGIKLIKESYIVIQESSSICLEN